MPSRLTVYLNDDDDAVRMSAPSRGSRRASGQVLAMVVDGQQDREVARALGISPRTVEVKARLMHKLGIERLSDLIRLSMECKLN